MLIIVSNNKKKINTAIEIKNEQIKKANNELVVNNTLLSNELEQNKKELERNKSELDKISAIKQTIHNAILEEQKVSESAFKMWADSLEREYDLKENECKEDYEIITSNLEKYYSDYQEKILAEIDKINQDLDKIKQAKAAAIEAQAKEQQVKEDLSFYCLQINPADLVDIQLLESIKPRLSKPRILSMLIWSTYWQKPMTTLCNNILGTKQITGIYKITNQKNDMCYIGQSVNVSDRWKQHAKCGLDIDTPAGNKLYKAMMEDGIYSFSWELLEECNKEELDEKEKFYIDLYNAYNYGYNSTTRK